MKNSPFLQVKKTAPLVHNITNYVTANDCANILLACGASPIMADDLLEVEEITRLCQSLVINIGTLNSHTIDAMLLAGKEAIKQSHPIIFDPVGVGASKLRTDTAQKLLQQLKPTIIRGNASEIKALSSSQKGSRGVDVHIGDKITEDCLEDAIIFAKTLSKNTGAIICITGTIDIVADSQSAYVIRNGHPFLSQITGSGCMLSALIGAYAAANPENLLYSCVTATVLMGLCGELAASNMTYCAPMIGTFKVKLFDAMSTMTEATLKAGERIEYFCQ